MITGYILDWHRPFKLLTTSKITITPGQKRKEQRSVWGHFRQSYMCMRKGFFKFCLVIAIPKSETVQVFI